MNQKPLTLLLIIVAITLCNNVFSQTSKELAIQQTVENKNWIGSGINNFDLAIIHFFQKFSQKNHLVDDYIVFIARNNFVKGGVLMILLWWLWFLPDTGDQIKRRVMIILALISGFIAILIGRLLVISLPFRLRPMNSPDLHLIIPIGATNEGLAKMSSFPSDHSVLFYAICTGLFFVSKKTGIFAFIYTFLFITFSRVYLCYHYPSDVFAGAIIGIAVCAFICNNRGMQKIGKKIYVFSEEKSQFFYPAFFIITYQLVDLFGEMRDVTAFLLHHL